MTGSDRAHASWAWERWALRLCNATLPDDSRRQALSQLKFDRWRELKTRWTLERCLGFNGAKTLAYVAAGLAQVLDLVLARRRREAEDLTLALFVATIQATINESK